jgi:serine/threonine protein kinase/tetratricopeptide (TPR) repeat protein
MVSDLRKEKIMSASIDQEAAIFRDAAELPAGEAREQYLEHVCQGDDNLLARLRRLLSRLEAGEASLGSPNAMIETSCIVSDEIRTRYAGRLSPGTQVGPYRLIEPIGEGGFGIVYLAEQDKTLRRRVALKVIKPGMDTAQVVARFEAERQVLAMMEHPHIARVFDAGETDQGRPYFAMELVPGTPITKYCDERKLTLRERLKLFATVCHAIRHAHQKGIIHRDIKPSNVLVTMQDDRAVPKIIDFGIAKATELSPTDDSTQTRDAQFVGSPMYMSPEQAKPGAQVDARTDVYSLGALLYELLTGMTPIDAEVLRMSGVDEMRRRIREEDPPPPSHRLGTLDRATLLVIAQARGQHDRQLKKHIHGELDWIVMRALAKEPSRRYQSTTEFAEDVERHLTDLPVTARRASLFYRVSKYARRHRRFLSVMALIGIATLVGSGLTYWIRTPVENDVHMAGIDFTKRQVPAADTTRAKAAVYLSNARLAVARKQWDLALDLLTRYVDECPNEEFILRFRPCTKIVQLAPQSYQDRVGRLARRQIYDSRNAEANCPSRRLTIALLDVIEPHVGGGDTRLNADELIASAAAWFSEGRKVWSEIQAEIKSMLEAEPGTLENYTWHVEASAFAGDHQSALRTFEALKRASVDPGASAIAARYFENNSDPGTSVVRIEDAEAIEKVVNEATEPPLRRYYRQASRLYSLATMRSSLGQADQAKAAFRRADAYVLRMIFAYGSNGPLPCDSPLPCESLIKALLPRLKSVKALPPNVFAGPNPADAVLWALRGKQQLERNDFAKAKAYFETARRIDPSLDLTEFQDPEAYEQQLAARAAHQVALGLERVHEPWRAQIAESVAGISVRVGNGEESFAVEPMAEPLHRWRDANVREGALIAFGSKGRPIALVDIAVGDDKQGILYEWTSLSDGLPPAARITATRKWTWAPITSGLSMRTLPDVNVDIATNESERQSHLLDLRKRFHVSSTGRTLNPFPGPVCSYSNPDAGIIDGALFLYVSPQNMNPEAVLVIEVCRADSELIWQYGLARLTASGISLLLDGKSVIGLPGGVRRDSHSNYWIVTEPPVPRGP